jgi:hypothetical protein
MEMREEKEKIEKIKEKKMDKIKYKKGMEMEKEIGEVKYIE